jgi:hypothetical protein
VQQYHCKAVLDEGRAVLHNLGNVLCGKLHCQLLVFAATGKGSRLLYLQDTTRGGQYLVDSGAEIYIPPASPAERCTTSQVPAAGQLVAANASKILAYGTHKEPLQFGSEQHSWPFILAAVNQAILGADFLHASGLLVNVQGQQLVDQQELNSSVTSCDKARRGGKIN